MSIGDLKFLYYIKFFHTEACNAYVVWREDCKPLDAYMRHTMNITHLRFKNALCRWRIDAEHIRRLTHLNSRIQLASGKR